MISVRQVIGIKKNGKYVRVAAFLLVGVIGVGIKFWLDAKKTPIQVYREDMTEESSAALQSVAESDVESKAPIITASPTPSEIPVYICGNVVTPDVYMVIPGIYLYELIALAGGLTEEADPGSIHLVFEITTPMSIYIPSRDEILAGMDDSPILIHSGISAGSDAVSGTGEATQIRQQVNINTATSSELETLPGIGESTAAAIISYREKVGRFSSIEDIMNVPGIKQGRFDALKDLITV